MQDRGPVDSLGPVAEATRFAPVEPGHRRDDMDAFRLEQATDPHRGEEPGRRVAAIDTPELGDVGVAEALASDRCREVDVDLFGDDHLPAVHSPGGIVEALVVEQRLGAIDLRLAEGPLPAEGRADHGVGEVGVVVIAVVVGNIDGRLRGGDRAAGLPVRSVVASHLPDRVGIVDHLVEHDRGLGWTDEGRHTHDRSGRRRLTVCSAVGRVRTFVVEQGSDGRGVGDPELVDVRLVVFGELVGVVQIVDQDAVRLGLALG